MAKFLRINMTDRTYALEDVPEAYKELGGGPNFHARP